MSEEIKKVVPPVAVPPVVVPKAQVPKAPVPKEEKKRFTITIDGDGGEKFMFSGPEGSSYINIEKAAYRLLTEFIVLKWRDSVIKDAKEKEAKDKEVKAVQPVVVPDKSVPPVAEPVKTGPVKTGPVKTEK